jgi:hypothetical protein
MRRARSAKGELSNSRFQSENRGENESHCLEASPDETQEPERLLEELEGEDKDEDIQESAGGEHPEHTSTRAHRPILANANLRDAEAALERE